MKQNIFEALGQDQMNLFVFDTDPVVCAKLHPNKLIIKAFLELGQCISTVIREQNPELADRYGFYKSTHKNHPTTKWIGASRANFLETLNLAEALHSEMLDRGYKFHKTYNFFPTLWRIFDRIKFPRAESTPYARAFNAQSGVAKDESVSAVDQYRKYLLTKSYTQPYDLAVQYITDYSNINFSNPELADMLSQIQSKLEIKDQVLDLYNKYDKDYNKVLETLSESLDKMGMHVAYYHLIQAGCADDLNFEIAKAYQAFCGRKLDYTVAPALREAKKSKKSPTSSPKAPKQAKAVKQISQRKQVIESIKSELQCKVPVLRGLDDVTLDRFQNHLHFWLMAHQDGLKAARAWDKTADGKGDMDYIKQNISESIYNLIK